MTTKFDIGQKVYFKHYDCSNIFKGIVRDIFIREDISIYSIMAEYGTCQHRTEEEIAATKEELIAKL